MKEIFTTKTIQNGKLVELSSRPMDQNFSDDELDCEPITQQDIDSGKLRPVSRIKTLRRALNMTQGEFAQKFHFSLGSLRDWEQGRYNPDQAVRAYLKVIAANPKAVIDVLSNTPNIRP